MKTIALLLALSASVAAAKPLDAVGSCAKNKPAGSIARVVKGSFAGPAATLRQTPAFATVHAANTQGEDPWLQNLSGRSGANRVYREAGHEVIVAAVCEPSDCDQLRAYIAYEPQSGHWGATVLEGRHLREIVQGAGQTTLAMHPSRLARALLCAIDTDAGTP